MVKHLLLISFFIPAAINASGANANAAAAACTSSAADDKVRADEKNGAAASAAADQKLAQAQPAVPSGQEIVEYLHELCLAHTSPYISQDSVFEYLQRDIRRDHFDWFAFEAKKSFVEALAFLDASDKYLNTKNVIRELIARHLLINRGETDIDALRKLSIDQLESLMHIYWTRPDDDRDRYNFSRNCEIGACMFLMGSHDDRATIGHDNEPNRLIPCIYEALSRSCPDLRSSFETYHIPNDLWPIILHYTGAFGVGVDKGIIVQDQLPGTSLSALIAGLRHISGGAPWLNLPHRGIGLLSGLGDLLATARPSNINLHGNRFQTLSEDFVDYVRDIGLDIVDLSNNRISAIATGLRGISTLILRGNQLTTIPEALLEEEFLQTLKRLDIRDNPVVKNPTEIAKLEVLRKRGIEVVIEDTKDFPDKMRTRREMAGVAIAKPQPTNTKPQT